MVANQFPVTTGAETRRQEWDQEAERIRREAADREVALVTTPVWQDQRATLELRNHARQLVVRFQSTASLSSEEGVALMCLAEALLRIPDSETADRLIAEAGNSNVLK